MEYLLKFLFHFGDRKKWTLPEKDEYDEEEDVEEIDLVKEEILKLWKESNILIEKTTLLCNRIRGSDLCLMLFYRKVKKLMEDWDFTCFGIKGQDEDMNRSNKASQRVNVDGTMERIKRGVARKPKRMVDDPAYIEPDQDRDTARPGGGKRKRNIFTLEEDTAIVSGVAQFQEGNWVQIKLASPHELRNRSPTQIKDRYRTLEAQDRIQYCAVIGGKYV
jgi:hypothetical protein